MIELHVGRGITRGAMTVFPLWSATSGYRRYTMGGRGLHVTESPEGPQVGTLMVGNVEDRPALVLAPRNVKSAPGLASRKVGGQFVWIVGNMPQDALNMALSSVKRLNVSALGTFLTPVVSNP